VYFSKASERESITIDSLTKVSNFLIVSAQQKKLVRQSVCAQVTKYPIWTGVLGEILIGLKSEIDFLNSRCPSKEIKMAQQIVATCQKFLESATSYDPESTSWMRLAPAKGAESPTSNKWEDVLEMFLDLINCLSEETKLTSEVKKLEVMKEGLYQIRDVLIDKSIGYKETRHQESLVHKKLSKTLGQEVSYDGETLLSELQHNHQFICFVADGLVRNYIFIPGTEVFGKKYGTRILKPLIPIAKIVASYADRQNF